MGLDASTTLAAFYAAVFDLVMDGLESNTRQSYMRAWQRRVAPSLGHLRLSEVTTLAISNARASWTVAESTKADALAVLSVTLNIAVMHGLLTTTATRSLPKRRGKVRDSDPTSRALDDLQVRRMLNLTADHPFGQRALGGLVFTGLRLGELVGLRWEDVDVARGLITVRRTFSPDGHGRLVERATKSGRVRHVPVLDELLPWLESARASGYEHVFTGERGGAFDSGNLSRHVSWPTIRDQIATFADGRPLRFHDLRHTFVSRLARLGVAPARIQKVAGHASITTTERYTHTSSTEAALAIREIVDGANREVANRGGESAAHTGQTRQNPRKSGGFDL